MLGDAPVYVKSGEQEIVTKSSTEADLVGISDALSQILWCREYLLSFGLALGPATIFQDNNFPGQQRTIYEREEQTH